MARRPIAWLPYRRLMPGRVRPRCIASGNDHGMMRMRQLDQLPVPAHGSVNLQPDGYHIMVMDVKRPVARRRAATAACYISPRRATVENVDVAVESLTAQSLIGLHHRSLPRDGKPPAGRPAAVTLGTAFAGNDASRMRDSADGYAHSRRVAASGLGGSPCGGLMARACL